MIYVVSGWVMTGTSMMMESLIAGGMDAAWSKDKDDLVNAQLETRTGLTYDEHYYELDRPEYRKEGFPADYEGKLIKVLYGGIPKLKASLQYRVIYMRRPQPQVVSNIAKIYGMKGVGNANRPNFNLKQEKAIAWMRDRPSQFLTVDEVWHGDLMKDPLYVFKRLALDRWPINPEKAAAIANKDKATTTQDSLASAG